GHAGRAFRSHDRDAVRARAPRTHECEGHAASTAPRTDRPGVQRRDRVPLAAAGNSAGSLRRARADRPPAWLTRVLSAALAHGARAAGATPHWHHRWPD